MAQFILLMLEDGTYKICENEKVKRRGEKRKKGCTIIDNEVVLTGTIIACNDDKDLLQTIRDLICTGSPRVSLESLPKSPFSRSFDHSQQPPNKMLFASPDNANLMDGLLTKIDKPALIMNNKSGAGSEDDDSRSSADMSYCKKFKISQTSKKIHKKDAGYRRTKKIPTTVHVREDTKCRKKTNIFKNVQSPEELFHSDIYGSSIHKINKGICSRKKSPDVGNESDAKKTDNQIKKPSPPIEINTSDMNENASLFENDQLIDTPQTSKQKEMSTVVDTNKKTNEMKRIKKVSDLSKKLQEIGYESELSDSQDEDYVPDSSASTGKSDFCDMLESDDSVFECSNSIKVPQTSTKKDNSTTVAKEDFQMKRKWRASYSSKENKKMIYDSELIDDQVTNYERNLNTSTTESHKSHIHNNENSIQESVLQTSTESVLNKCLNKTSSPACNDANFVVKKSVTGGGKKSNSCHFCKKIVCKIGRHLLTVHKDEQEIKDIIALKPKDSKRLQVLDSLRKMGNFKHNTKSELNTGELIVTRRPNERYKKCADDYEYCANCKGLFSKKTLRIHFRKCTGKDASKSKFACLAGKKIAPKVHPKASHVVVNKLFPHLRQDNVVRSVSYDELVITFINKQCEKYRISDHFIKMIKQRLRTLGRFFVAFKGINNKVTDFSSVFDPENFDDTIEAVNIVAGYDKKSSTYKSLSTATDLGTLLQKVCNVHITQCIKEKKSDKMKNAEDFLKVMNQEFLICVSKPVEEAKAKLDRRKVVKLPDESDIEKLMQYLSEKRHSAYMELKQKFSYKTWLELSKAVLILIQVFNRRRAGETERIFVDDFMGNKGIDDTIIDFDKLSANGRQNASKYVRFEIRGKKNRTVPVLLDENMLLSLQLLLKNRGKAKINVGNPYLFAVAHADKTIHRHLEACPLLREFATQCGARNPNLLRGTQLRKHMATKCILLNLNAEGAGRVSKHLGHSQAIHDQIYKQTLLSREIGEMANVLEAINSGTQEHSDSDSDDESHEKTEQNVNVTESTITNSKTQQLTQNKTKPTLKRRQRRSSSPKASIKRVPWQEVEKEILLDKYGAYVHTISTVFPALKDIAAFINETPELKSRSPAHVKTFLSNTKQMMRKMN